ncbi:hypothetical protein ABK16_12545 [Vibrio parahaemolyticus]|nr:hypothetical protein ABK16_12545 [Vibrio parahaemolyticus]
MMQAPLNMLGQKAWVGVLKGLLIGDVGLKTIIESKLPRALTSIIDNLKALTCFGEQHRTRGLAHDGRIGDQSHPFMKGFFSDQ